MFALACGYFLQQLFFDKILLCICDEMNIAFNGFTILGFSIVSSLSDFDF